MLGGAAGEVAARVAGAVVGGDGAGSLGPGGFGLGSLGARARASPGCAAVSVAGGSPPGHGTDSPAGVARWFGGAVWVVAGAAEARGRQPSATRRIEIEIKDARMIVLVVP